MTELRVIVENVVRPVRARIGRKLRMCEELLTHVTAVYDEEIQRGSTHAEALRHTQQRFGDNEAIRDDLQSSVPRWEAMSFTQIGWQQWSWGQWGTRRQNETKSHQLTRIAVLHGFLSAGLYALILFAGLPFMGGVSPGPYQVPWGILVFGLLQAVSIWMLHWSGPALLDKTIEHEGTNRQFLFRVAGFFFMLSHMLILGLSVYLFLDPSIPASTWGLLIGAVVGLPGLFAPLLGYQFWPGRLVEWQHLLLQKNNDRTI
ncbi:MAG: hypothetical protein HYV26_06995 [Candidatus Hydrogenedentes bacterium]|nr:hypothetical protein [Candidatus Hydrogenedentota bacterium]